jgi:hypothetical protein
MSDIMSILQNSYAVPQSVISPGDKFKAVDPTQYQGTWTGKDYKNQPITVSITKVRGYRANVVLQTSAGLQFQNALITTKGTFRIGDSQFKLTGSGAAQISTIVTDPTTGIQTDNQAILTLKT